MADTSDLFSTLTAIDHKAANPDKIGRLLRMPALFRALTEPTIQSSLLASDDFSLHSIERAIRSAASEEPIAQAAIEIIERGSSFDSLEAVVDFVEAAQPPRHRLEAMLSFAFMQDEAGSFIADCIHSSSSFIQQAAVQAYVSVAVLNDELQPLPSIAESTEELILKQALLNGDSQVAEAISGGSSAKSAVGQPSQIKAGIESWANGELDQAQAEMEAAWQDATERAAEIAEGIAQLAAESDQPLVETEAYRRALQMQPSAIRRASLALATLKAGEIQAASQILEEGGQTSCEHIARAEVSLAMGQKEKAESYYKSVDWADLPANPSWGMRLLRGWLQLGAAGEAVQVAEWLVDSHPAGAECRRQASLAYSSAGQPEAALEQAQILNLLEPSEVANKQLLAEALEQNGQPEASLEYWLEISQEMPEVKDKVVAAALAAGRMDTALTFAQQLVESDPQSAKARLALGKSLIQSGNPQGGLVHIRRATELDPAEPEAWLALAQAQENEGHLEACGETLSEASQLVPDNPTILQAYAEWLEAQERFTEALETIEKAHQLQPENPDYAIQQADLLVRMGHYQDAEPLLEKVVRQQPTNWQARVSLAAVHERQDNPSSALRLIEDLPEDSEAEAFALLARTTIKVAKVGDIDSGEKALAALRQASAKGYSEPDHGYWQARALQLTGANDEALQQFQAAQKSLPAGAEDLRSACLHGQAEAALACDQVPVAISLLERARSSDQIQPASLALLSKAYLAAGLAEESLAPAVEACEQDPSDPTIRAQYLAACKVNGGARQALESIDEWIKEDPDSSELKFAKAELHSDLNEVESARNTLASLTWENRHQPSALDRIANQLMTIGQPDSAARLLSHADYQEPNRPSRLKQLAEASTAAGDFQLAAASWNNLIQVQPENIEALLGAAEANWQLDQRVAAIGLWQRALTIEPERADLHATLARAQLANGESSQALEHFRSAAELAPEDKSIRIEAAHALMANHNYSQALTLLNNGLEKSTEPQPDELALLAQIYLGLGRPQEALVSIGRAPSDNSTAKLEALASIANSRLGNGDQATQKLVEATTKQPASIDEATWVARAALEQGDWQAALESAEQGSEIAQGTWQAAELQLAVKCRIADAYTLLATLGSASQHAPSPSLVGESTFRELSALIDAIKNAGRPHSQVEAWNARLHAAFGRDHAAGGQPLQSLPADHIIRQQAIEGLALTQLEAENPEGALRTLAAAPESLQAGPWSPIIAGLAHMQLDRPEMARKAFGAVDKTMPIWPLAAFLVGRSWYSQARIDEAINSWNAAVLAWPAEIRWQSELALAYRQLDKPEAALPHLQTALEASPDQHDLRLPLARSLFELGEISQAVKQYQLVRPQFDEDPEILTEIGQALLADGQSSEAYQQFQAALALAPDHLAAEVGAAQAAWQQGEERLAEKHSAKAMRRNPRQVDLLVALTEIMLAAGKAGQALALLEEAYGQAKPPVAIARLKAKAYFEMGRAQDSINLLKSVVDEDPEDDQAWAAMAEAYASANQAGQAIDALRMALNLRPGYKPYRMKLARLFRETGQLDQALDELTDLQNDDPKDHQIPLEIGLVHRARRQLQQALNSFQQSISLNESSASAYFQAGMVLKGLKAYQQSVEMLERAVSLNPKDSEAMHQLAAVQALQLVHGGIQTSAVS